MSDPIRVVDRRNLPFINVHRVANYVEGDIANMKAFLLEKGFSQKNVDNWETPTHEMVAGYVSNVRAHLYNETRRYKEAFVDFSANGTREEMLQWLSNASFNAGHFDLSINTHARATYRSSLFDFYERSGYNRLAMIVPTRYRTQISHSGILSRFIGRSLDVDEWRAISKKLKEDTRSASLIFTLGLHHNDKTQFMPVPDILGVSAANVLRAYRRDLLRDLKKDT